MYSNYSIKEYDFVTRTELAQRMCKGIEFAVAFDSQKIKSMYDLGIPPMKACYLLMDMTIPPVVEADEDEEDICEEDF
jgi:hypothetical protein